jgi:hypothetical protein
MSQKGFKETITLRFLFGIFFSPIAVSLLMAPRLFDFFFPELAPGFKALVLIISLMILLWVMLDSSRTALYVTTWIITISVFAFAFEVDRLLPPEKPLTVQVPQAQVQVSRQQIKQTKKILKKENDTLQYSSFDAKEGTPIPTPTPTPNLTPFFDLSSLTAKDQSIGTLPNSAFFGSNGSKNYTGGIMDMIKRAYRSIFGG